MIKIFIYVITFVFVAIFICLQFGINNDIICYVIMGCFWVLGVALDMGDKGVLLYPMSFAGILYCYYAYGVYTALQ
jgi:hypothetical protein